MSNPIEENGMSVQYQCPTCNLTGERCVLCQDEMDANDTARAWELVDEGNMQYRYTLSHVQSNPSGHDWVSAVNYLQKPALLMDGTLQYFRYEYAPTSVKIEDGLTEESLLHLNLQELEDETQRAREVECPWCHLMTPKQFNDCQDCDKPLELNVR